MHLQKGRDGEQIAAELLTTKGYVIAERNYRSGRAEIDLIAWQHDRLLVFVEVKTRSGEGFGGPEEAVSVAKQKRIVAAAGRYMESIGYDWAVRFDVIAVVLSPGNPPEVRHHEDAFFWM